MNNQTGSTSLIITLVGLLIVAVAGYVMYQSTTSTSTLETAMTEEISDQDVMNEDPNMDGELMDDTGYMGTLLAGNQSPYYEFNQTDYEKALADGKIVFLEYYADWCPICRAEQPNIEAGFDLLNNPDIVGFRVNYNDTKTDDYEKTLAEEHGITYQHTKVIIKDGEIVLKDGEVWETPDFKRNMSAAL